MLKVGITGGIGAGKSVVCRVFSTLGIPVFDADHTAKWLMEHDAELMAGIKQLFGEGIYRDNILNREEVASIVFREPGKLKKLNELVHPATIAYGRKWMAEQHTPYAIKEAAIFFESGTHKDMDVIIGVTAPEEIRIKRALERPGMTREKIKNRIANQMDEAEKMQLCDHVVINDGEAAIIPQVMAIHKQLLEQ